MRPALIKNVALLFIVLGVSPFTAPFSSVDLTARPTRGLSSDRDANHDQPSNDHGRHGAVIRTAAHRLTPLASAVTPPAAPPEAARSSFLPGAHAVAPSAHRVPIQVLRI